MVGILAKNGGMQGIVDNISKYAKSPRTGQLATWAMGILIFFDDYANTLLVGNTMRAFTDKLRISREKLSYIVDSTAAPVASIALISTWIGFELGLIQDAFADMNLQRGVYITFVQTIPYRFYSIFTLVFIFFISAYSRDFGPMLKAERRARSTGKYIRDGAMPLSDEAMEKIDLPPDMPRRWYNALIPIFSVIIITILGLYINGRVKLAERASTAPLYEIFGAADSFSVLMWAAFGGSIVAGVLSVSQKLLSLRSTISSWISGIKSMIIAPAILILAWSIGKICSDLNTAGYVVSITKGILSPHMLPVLTFIIAASISFATGTSWGTMAILTPIVIPMAFSMGAGYSEGLRESIFLSTIGAVLAGSTFGDHCSPISDTTILSSMASGSDHIDHVKTQIPYAIFTASLGLIIGYLPAGFGINPVISLVAGVIVMFILVQFFSRNMIEPSN
ncbi:MAG: Na+/H+ antiporter NhaC family protein [Fidelibacterota bacterium]